ncbi:MAG: guanylate kinase [Xanthomonadaceae bacterium]|nr:guanylate kinase [Xanthomonadaceae bacterium]
MIPGTLWIVSAPSGGGKTSLTRALLPRLSAKGWAAEISVSYTTRAPRPGEQEGIHYHFVDEPAFATMVEHGDFLEHAEVFGKHYGTGLTRTKELLGRGVDVILDIDWQGARQVRARRSDVQSVFILPPSSAELERRLRARGTDSDEVIAARMRAARAEMSHHGEYDYLLVNRDFERALEEMAAIFVARRLRGATQQARHEALIDHLLAEAAP